MLVQRRALITGITGFIGSHLARALLHEGWFVVALIRIETLRGGFTAPTAVLVVPYDGTTESMMDAVLQAKPSVVFHLASLLIGRHTPGQIERLIQSNILMGTQLLEAMVFHGCRSLINTGTSLQNSYGPEYNPSSLYAATKQAFEAIVGYYAKSANLSYLTLNIYSAYGLGDKSARVLNYLIRQLTSSDTLAMSPGNQKLDLIHVEDICAAFLIAEELLRDPSANICQSYAIATGHLHSLLESRVGRPTLSAGRGADSVDWTAPARFRAQDRS